MLSHLFTLPACLSSSSIAIKRKLGFYQRFTVDGFKSAITRQITCTPDLSRPQFPSCRRRLSSHRFAGPIFDDRVRRWRVKLPVVLPRCRVLHVDRALTTDNPLDFPDRVHAGGANYRGSIIS
jgi:hypothetical protein